MSRKTVLKISDFKLKIPARLHPFPIKFSWNFILFVIIVTLLAVLRLPISVNRLA